jgi:hypothetical protein
MSLFTKKHLHRLHTSRGVFKQLQQEQPDTPVKCHGGCGKKYKARELNAARRCRGCEEADARRRAIARSSALTGR